VHRGDRTDVSADLPGERMFVQSRVTDLKGKPLAGVPVDIWHADDDGFYDSQRPNYETQGPSSRARFITDADGRFFFRTILPCSYPIPTDGPVWEMILQVRRHAMRPAHVHFPVDAPGHQPLITQSSSTATNISIPTWCSGSRTSWSPKLKSAPIRRRRTASRRPRHGTS
jgi:protocatechuate 3,4-dioxygenase beta subunit